MRHNKKFNHLGRKSAHRKAMLSNMASSLILNKRIITTTAKAKALRVYVEPLITRAKPENNTTTEQGSSNRRVVFSYLQNKYAVTELFREVGPKVATRPGGYTRIIRMPENRLGDAAEMAMMESLTTMRFTPARVKRPLPKPRPLVAARNPLPKQKLKKLLKNEDKFY